MQSLAQAWLALKLTNSPQVLGTIATVQFTPILILSLFGGVIADRVPKRRLLLFTQTCMLVQAAVLGVLASTGLIRVVHLYLLAACLGVLNAVDMPSRQAFVAEMVEREDLPNAVALNSMLMNSSRLLGPGLGGLTIALVGIAGCFYINSASFVAVIACLLLMRTDRLLPAPPQRAGRVLSQIREGLGEAWRVPDLMLVLLLIGIFGTFGYNFQVLLPLIARYILNSGAAGFGILGSTIGAGSLIGAFGYAYRGRPTRRTLLIGAVFFALLFCTLAFSRSWLVTIPVLLILGIASNMFQTTASTRMQLVSPPRMRGRMMSIYSLLFIGSTPIGASVVGLLAEHLGVPKTIVIMSAICGLGVLAALVLIRQTRDRLLPDEPGALVGLHDQVPLPEPSGVREPSGD